MPILFLFFFLKCCLLQATTTELSSYDRNCIFRSSNIYCLVFYRRSLLMPGLGCQQFIVLIEVEKKK